MPKKMCVVYTEGAVTECVKNGLWGFTMGGFLLDNASWLGRPVKADSDWDINWEQSILYHMGDSQHKICKSIK